MYCHIESSATGGDFKKVTLCIQKNAHYYIGEWIAVLDGKIVGHNKSRITLHNCLKQEGKLKATFFKVDNPNKLGG